MSHFSCRSCTKYVTALQAEEMNNIVGDAFKMSYARLKMISKTKDSFNKATEGQAVHESDQKQSEANEGSVKKRYGTQRFLYIHFCEASVVVGYVTYPHHQSPQQQLLTKSVEAVVWNWKVARISCQLIKWIRSSKAWKRVSVDRSF